jgi:Rps23 Pro-64 3,4-dihydroxylase Tpa1-like proline 4-hydroxylase
MTTIPKLNKIFLKSINQKNNLDTFFGSWTNNIIELSNKFQQSGNLKHIIIENFLDDKYINKLVTEFPKQNKTLWWEYKNPIEYKYACDKISLLSENLELYFYLLSSTYFLKLMRELTNIKDLEVDDYLHGAGLHMHPRNGRLGLHLDYEKHPITGKQRRINIILYLNKKWEKEWKGATELWNKNVTECIGNSPVVFNNAIIFQTDETSWHGLPEPIMCPEGEYRMTLAYYYVSPLISRNNTNKYGADDTGYRTKASFIKRPQDKEDERMNELYKIRPQRRIEKEDLERLGFIEWL